MIKIKPYNDFNGAVLLCLAALEVTAVYYYGPRAFLTAALSAAVCLICGLTVSAAEKRPLTDVIIPAVSEGLMLALMMPASVPYHIIVICGIFAEAVTVQCFGGHGNEIFSGAGTAYLFGEICFPKEVLSYPQVFERLGLSSSVSCPLYGSLSGTMLVADTSPVSDYELILGRCVSPMGTGVLALMAVSGIFLIFTGNVSVTAFLTQTAVYGIFSYLYGAGIFDLKYNIMTGMYLFMSVFVTCRRVPRSLMGRMAYGAVTGALICVFRYYAAAENPIIYAAVISAPFIFIFSGNGNNYTAKGETHNGRKTEKD